MKKIISVCVLFMFAGLVHAGLTPLFSETFESYADGASLSSPWVVQLNTGATAGSSYATVSTTRWPGHSKVLAVYDGSAGGCRTRAMVSTGFARGANLRVSANFASTSGGAWTSMVFGFREDATVVTGTSGPGEQGSGYEVCIAGLTGTGNIFSATPACTGIILNSLDGGYGIYGGYSNYGIFASTDAAFAQALNAANQTTMGIKIRVWMGNTTGAFAETSTDFGATWAPVKAGNGNTFDTRGWAVTGGWVVQSSVTDTAGGVLGPGPLNGGTYPGYCRESDGTPKSPGFVFCGSQSAGDGLFENGGALFDDIVVEDDTHLVPVELSSFSVE